ncbi:DNA replication and repair protein RecF [Jannaschia pagri]|uniref:DNA replication and repair protein RecF n=1 Tax=Jannaschia pagri TaxID=2829797 RepID=A0ABQ4NQQ7_9RHOB|nr:MULTISPECIES: DNA replication/repair protein RecF [unclassified Jannaschia]GIT92780.1 DNA replication and repair protein RecF [Jannaschia sp. AI_61]GIT96615.1 DNA replication and repair protein RecF [Jannaschia sp. AI_62]
MSDSPRVATLSLSHFRSHRRTHLAFDGRIVAIHGPNGAGKTNLLEAVSLLSPGRGMRRAAAEEIIRRPEAIGWRITAALTPHHDVELRAEPRQPRTTRIDDKNAPQVALARLLRVVWLVPAMDRLWLEGAEGRRRFLDRIVLSFLPDHAEGVLRYEKAMRDRNRLLRDGVRDAHWYGALEAQMAEAGASIGARRADALSRLTAAQPSDGPFPAAALRLSDEGAPATEEDLRTAFADSRPRDMAAGRTLVGPHRADLIGTYAAKDMEARLCSTGEQKALLISLILANARALRDETGHAPILLLDEVAAHLDAGRRAALYDELKALGGQAFLTGTGPELFAELGTSAHHLRVTEAGGESTVEEAT